MDDDFIKAHQSIYSVEGVDDTVIYSKPGPRKASQTQGQESAQRKAAQKASREHGRLCDWLATRCDC
jgi:hypothetical protein